MQEIDEQELDYVALEDLDKLGLGSHSNPRRKNWDRVCTVINDGVPLGVKLVVDVVEKKGSATGLASNLNSPETYLKKHPNNLRPRMEGITALWQEVRPGSYAVYVVRHADEQA